MVVINSKVIAKIGRQLKFRGSEVDYDQLSAAGYSVRFIPPRNDQANGMILLGLDDFLKDLDHESICFQEKDNPIVCHMLDRGEVIASLVVAEFGGYDPDTNFGIGQTVCGLSGKALKPFHICNKPGQDHAVFGLPGSAIICRAQYKSDRRIVLEVFDAAIRYVKETRVVDFKITRIWNGTRFYEAARSYMTALSFALSKAITPNCDALHIM